MVDLCGVVGTSVEKPAEDAGVLAYRGDTTSVGDGRN